MKTIQPRTSLAHPLQIAEVVPNLGMGKIGLTLCPGKVQSTGLTGSWARDLSLDVEAISEWNASVVLTLVEAEELARLQVPNLGKAVRDRHMEWLHLPIRDRDVPDAAFEAAWIETGEQLRARLRLGFNVLIHCMGGLGRAGTIASRLLVELGWRPRDSIREVRRVRPGALETRGQEDFVHSCSAVAEAKPGRTIGAVRDRAIGSLLGLAVGDALGTTLEFTARDNRPRVTGIEGGGPFQLKPGQWTDDTSMALALADSLLRCDGLDEHDLMTRFVSWWKHGSYSSTGQCFDIGTTVRGALLRLQEQGNPVAGSIDPMSAGNGSLMRLSPVSIRYWDDGERRRDAAARQSRTTHGAPEAVDACVSFGDMLAEAIAGEPKGEVLRARSGCWSGAIRPILAGSWRGKPRSMIASSGYVAHSLEAAVCSVGRTSSFADAVLLAANLGGDADTVAAITGQLAGAIYGASGIPGEWLDTVYSRDDIQSLAAGLFDSAARKSVGG